MIALLILAGQVATAQPVATSDPAVELSNTGGTVARTIVEPPENDRRTAAEQSVHEWMVAGGAARSVKIFQSTAGRAYALQTIGYARDLTRELATGVFRGRFAWGFEATPLFAQFQPSTIYGVGFAPVVWRWNFAPRPRWSAFAELSMGGVLTTEPIPDKTSRVNFSAHWGAGVRRRLGGRNSLLLAYRLQHFSNGNQFNSNPGVNSHVFLAGWSHRS